MSAETYHARVSDGRRVFVAVTEEDRPMAFLELEADGHIDCFYCHPDAAGQGIGLALYTEAARAATDQGISCLTVEASEAARRFFVKVGFEVVSRRDFLIRTVPIHNYAMRKALT